MKIIFATAEEAPENLREKLVKQEDGTFLYEGDGLVRKNQELVDEVKKLKGITNLLKGLDPAQLTPEKIQAALNEYEQKDAMELKIQERIQAAVEANSTKWSDKIKASEGKVAKMQSALEKYLIDSQLTAAIAAENGDPMFVAPVLRGRLKVIEDAAKGEFHVRVLNDKGEIDLDAEGKPVDVKALVSGAKNDKAFASVFRAPAASGTGTTPGAGQGSGNGSAGAPGTFVPDAKGVVTIPREQAKNAVAFRQALEAVKGDYSKVAIESAPTTAAQ